MKQKEVVMGSVVQGSKSLGYSGYTFETERGLLNPFLPRVAVECTTIDKKDQRFDIGELLGIVDWYKFEKEVQQETIKHKRLIICVCSIWVVSLMVAVLVPTKDAMYKMLIASYVTTDNIQIVNEAIKTNLQDYLNMLGETVKNMR